MRSPASVVRKLVRQIERDDGLDQLPDFWKRVTLTEELFVRRAVKGAADRKSKIRMLRYGWPDFMIVEGGRVYCVEVKKTRMERLRKTQVAMFTELEKLGIRVLVWSADRPNRLFGWAAWGESEGA